MDQKAPFNEQSDNKHLRLKSNKIATQGLVDGAISNHTKIGNYDKKFARELTGFIA